LDLGGLRIIHACWHPDYIDAAKQVLPNARLHPDLLVDAATEGTVLYDVIETLLKGFEVKLPEGITFPDKDNHPRDAVRVRWWERDAQTLGEVVQPPDIDIAHAAGLPIPENAPQYCLDAPPCFVGHYWLKGQPEALTSNVACLDYSVAKGGQLVAYRWSGERVLDSDNFSYVTAGIGGAEI
jgi:hypothetical protein